MFGHICLSIIFLLKNSSFNHKYILTFQEYLEIKGVLILLEKANLSASKNYNASLCKGTNIYCLQTKKYLGRRNKGEKILERKETK